jgi:hypothetical protein
VSLILATILSAAALAQTPPPAQPVTTTTATATATAQTKTQGRHVDKHDDKHKKDNPDPALLGFLGDYEDAADGLDPIGLSEQTESDKPKDGHGQ